MTINLKHLQAIVAAAMCIVIPAQAKNATGLENRHLTANELTAMNAIYQNGTSPYPINLDRERIWNFRTSKDKAVETALKRLQGEIGTAFNGMPRSEFLKRARAILNNIDGITLGYDIYFVNYEPDYAIVVNDQALLAHENIHVWQWQYADISHYSLAKVIWEHIQYGDNVYKYSLEASKKFLDYRYEQQGQMLFDYVYKKCANDPGYKQLESLIGQGLGITPHVTCSFNKAGTPNATSPP